MSDRVQEYIDKENARRGRGPDEEGDGGDDPDEEGEEEDRLERLKESILDG